MAYSGACDLYIEQEIQDGLESGKKPYSIGKELSIWIEKMFEVHIKPGTLATRACRQRDKECTKQQSKVKHIKYNTKHDIAVGLIADKLEKVFGFDSIYTEESCPVTGLRPDITIKLNDGKFIYCEVGTTQAEKITAYKNSKIVSEVWWYDRNTLERVAII